jgi:hypothetical protein
MKTIGIFAIAALLGLGALLVGTNASRAANSWNLPGEEATRFDAKVVDVLCVLTGDCPADCGGGKRVMGLLRDSGELVLATKNAGPFTGTAHDLVPFCNQTVTADGLFTINYGVKTFALQFVKPKDGDWRGANAFVKDWAKERSLDLKDAKVKQWFRNDEMVKALIDEQGKLGLKDKGITP